MLTQIDKHSEDYLRVNAIEFTRRVFITMQNFKLYNDSIASKMARHFDTMSNCLNGHPFSGTYGLAFRIQIISRFYKDNVLSFRIFFLIF